MLPPCSYACYKECQCLAALYFSHCVLRVFLSLVALSLVCLLQAQQHTCVTFLSAYGKSPRQKLPYSSSLSCVCGASGDVRSELFVRTSDVNGCGISNRLSAQSQLHYEFYEWWTNCQSAGETTTACRPKQETTIVSLFTTRPESLRIRTCSIRKLTVDTTRPSTSRASSSLKVYTTNVPCYRLHR